jgi:prepilin-type N-terminal cleavage/methylation domain-containing protein
MQIKISRRAGFTLVEIMIVMAIIGLLAGISTPSVLKARDTSQLNAIINNLRLIESAKEQWALDTRQGTGVVPADTDVAPFLKLNAMPTPIVGETYNINPVGQLADATTPVKLGTIPVGGTISLR